MPFSLARLHIGCSRRTADQQRLPQQDAHGSGDPEPTDSGQRLPTPIPPRARFGFSWFKRVRSRKGGDASQRPPTPTPYLISHAAASAPATDTGPKKLRRVQPRTLFTLVPAGISKPGADKPEKEAVEDDDDDDDDDEDDEERRISDAECVRLNSFARGLQGLIAELQRRDEEARTVPPMKNADGTPLSPIVEADEFDADFEMHFDSPFESELSEEVVGQKDFACMPCLPTALLGLGPDAMSTRSSTLDEVGAMEDASEDEPRANVLPGLPVLHDHDDGDRVEEAAVDDCGIAAAGAETETEDEQEHFPAPDAVPSPPVSSSDEDDEEDYGTSDPGLALRLRGLDLARPYSWVSFSAAASQDGHAEQTEDGYEEDGELEDGGTLFTARRVQRTRAVTLATARERPLSSLPRLPPLVIPSLAPVPPATHAEELAAQEDRSWEGTQSVDELMRTVVQLQREKVRLEQALVGAERKIDDQSTQLTALTAQIAALRESLRRLTCPDDEGAAQPAVPIFVHAPPLEDGDAGAGDADSGVGPAGSAPNRNDNTLSTPPATPDRRAVSALAEGAVDARTPTPERARGRELVRSRSAGAASSLRVAAADARELGVGRAQIRRRIGSVDLRSLDMSWP